jgi:hypothetical protein
MPPPPKNSWDINPDGRLARRNATKEFLTFLHDPNNVAQRRACTLPKPTPAEEEAASLAAKTLFADKGGFLLQADPVNYPNIKPIPAKTKFRVYEFDPEAGRDEVVNLILPPPPPTTFPDPFDALDWYPCTYWPY